MTARDGLAGLFVFVGLCLVLVTGVPVVASQPAGRSDAATDAEGRPLPGTTVPCAPIAEKKQELGCYVVGHPKLGRLPTDTPLAWQLDIFPNRATAAAAKNQFGTVTEAFDRTWLFTIAPPDWRPAGAEHVATVGPLAVEPKVAEYAAMYLATTFRPGLSSFVHRHPGPEAWFILSGEQCLETPDGPIFGRAGDGVVVRGDLPMTVRAIGSDIRRNFTLILHDSLKPAATPVDDWKPRGLCRD